MKQRKPIKTCRQCQKTLPIENFAYKRLTTTNKAYTAASCNGCARTPQVRGRGPHWVPNPCVNCGKRFKFVGTWSSVRRLKTCSDLCYRRQRDSNKRKCSRCSRKLPIMEFARRNNSRKRYRACKRCLNQAARDIAYAGFERRSARVMLNQAQRCALKVQQEFTLSIKDARKFYDGDCYVCGHAPHLLKPAPDQTTWAADTCRAYCTICTKLVAQMGESVAILFANEIASRHPLMPVKEEEADEDEGRLDVG